MKRFVWIVLLLCSLWAVANGEQTAEEAAMQPIRAAYPECVLLTADQWGNTAAAVLGQGEQRILCIAECIRGEWQLTIANEKALPMGETIRLFLDTDISLFWSYEDEGHHYSFSSFREKDIWQTPVCIKRDWIDSSRTLYTETAHEYENGLLSFRVSRWDENENKQSEYTVGPFPAAWVKEMDSLAAYREAEYPNASKVTENSWLNSHALAMCAGEIQPEYAFAGGAATEDGLELWMQDEKGALRLVTWHMMEQGPVTNISLPLPEGTVYGYENFSHCLWLPGGIVADVAPFADGAWHVRYAFGDRAEGNMLFFGRNWIREGSGSNGHYFIGDHPWKDLNMDWATLPAGLSQAREKLDASRWAVVHNPDPEDRLHLRERDDKNAASFGKFYNGTPVEVLRKYNGWVFVRIPGGYSGWMMEKYLAFGTNGWGVENAFPTLRFVDEKDSFTVWNTGSILCGDEPATWTVKKGEPCCIIGVYGDEWFHVWFPEMDAGGMMQQGDFWPGNG